MGKMPHIDWKEWATKWPDWMRQDATSAFETFIERKWLDALNIAAAEPAPWKGDGERAVGGVRAPDNATGSGRGVLRVTGAVNVIEQGDSPQVPFPLVGPLLWQEVPGPEPDRVQWGPCDAPM